MYLAHLFPEVTFEELTDIFQILRTSKKDILLAELLLMAQKATKDESVFDSVDWVHFYATDHAQICLEIMAAHLQSNERQKFLRQHQERKEKLKNHIERVVNQTPLVSGKTLRSIGIPQGKLLGDIVREAERVAILQNIDSQDNLLNLLQKSSLWPKQ